MDEIFRAFAEYCDLPHDVEDKEFLGQFTRIMMKYAMVLREYVTSVDAIVRNEELYMRIHGDLSTILEELTVYWNLLNAEERH